jgi:glycerophosphoryl diester phosphodiesterase
MAEFYNIGHRGAAAYQPENTVASLEEAIIRRADMIEFDIRRTADGLIVLFHNRDIKSRSGQRRAISKMNFAELAEIAAADGYELAKFEDVLERFGPRIPLDIEIKVSGFEADVVRLLGIHPPAYKPTLSSFYPWVVGRLKRFDKSLSTALILGRQRVHRFKILARPAIRRLITTLGISSIHLQDTIVSPAMVDNLAGSGVTVFVWTVDDPAEMRRFLRMGVDGIITNKPDLLYQVCLEMADAREPILKKITDNIGRFAYAM